MSYIVLDFESFYSTEYSLRRMTPVEYILDPRFECFGAAVAEGDTGPARWYDCGPLRDYLKGKRAEQKLGKKLVVVSHNALFDMCLLAWRFGVVPDLMIDTMGMSRALVFHKTGSVSLETVAAHLGLGVKGNTIKHVSGLDAAAIKRADLWTEFVAYAIHDAELCRRILQKLRPQFPPEEFLVQDMVLRCAITPRFKLDATLLAEHAHQIQVDKQSLLDRCGIEKPELMSNDKFAEALRRLGVEPPRKVSPVTGKETWAFAKTDQAMAELEEDPNPDVQALVAARLGFKSTIEETRTARFQAIAGLTWPGNLGEGWMPIPLRYSGAHTHRLCLSGETVIATLRDNRVVYTRLDQLQRTDLVWDGEVFVSHGGLAYAGIKEVIEYDGIVGTPDHRVWTVEHGYRSLAEAKARGDYVARGSVPDPVRIDSSVHRVGGVQDPYTVHLRQVRRGDELHVEGLARSQSCLVSLLPQEGADGRKVTSPGNGGTGRTGQPGGRSAAATPAGCASGQRGSSHPRDDSFAGAEVIEGLARRRLERSDVSGAAGVPALHQSEHKPLRLLWRSGDRLRVHVDGLDGGLDLAPARPEAGGDEPRSDRHERALRAREPALGDAVGADAEPKLVATWDIVDCGPRNRFMANGRIVHNSGDWKLNLQNLNRGGALRRALVAPPGCTVVTCDAAQIEARIVAWLAGATELVEAFAQGRDVYSEFATRVYGYPVNKKEHPAERFTGKTGVLGLGFGVGAPKFRDAVKTGSRLQLGREIDLGAEFAQVVVNSYRLELAPQVPAVWKFLQNAIPMMARGGAVPDLGPVRFEPQAILLPSGLRLFYPDLRQEVTDKGTEWVCTYGKKPKRIYGGKLYENIVQALARIIVLDAAVRIRKRFPKIPLAHQVHDELVYVPPLAAAAELKQALEEEMSTPPGWAPGLPLAAEAGEGPSYGDAK